MCFIRVISINTKIRSLRESLPQNGYSQFEPPKKDDLAKRVLSQIKELNRKIKVGVTLKLTVDKHGYNVNELSQDMKDALKTYDKLLQNMRDALKTYERVSWDMMETLKTYELHEETKEEDMYKCTYCRNWKADGEEFYKREDSVQKCIYCGNLSFESVRYMFIK